MTPEQRRGLVAAIAAVSVFAFSLSLTVPLVAILLERMGATGFQIGLNSAASAIAITAGGIVFPALLRRLTLPQLIVGSALAMAATLCVFLAAPNVWIWLIFRFLIGACASAIFFGSELWIVSVAPQERRGLFLGVYGIFLSIGFLAGPLLLKLTGTDGWTPFLAGAAITLMVIPPVLWARAVAPDMSEPEGHGPPSPVSIIRFFRTDPSVLWAIVLFGCIEFGGMGLIPVWSLKVGMTEQAALTLVALLPAGNLLTQIPLGMMADRYDRRRLLALSAGFCVLAAFAMPVFAGTQWPLWVTTALWGGLAVGLYTFALAELGSRYKGAELARANGAFMSAYGLGSLLAPPAMGATMDLWPPHGMFGLMALLAAIYMTLVLVRTRVAA